MNQNEDNRKNTACNLYKSAEDNTTDAEFYAEQENKQDAMKKDLITLRTRILQIRYKTNRINQDMYWMRKNINGLNNMMETFSVNYMDTDLDFENQQTED